MAFCSSATKAIKQVWNEIDSVLGKFIDEITKVTGMIKDLEANPTVDAIVKVIPGGSAVEIWLNVAIDEILGVTNSVKTLSEKLNEWLSSATSESDRNKKLFNLASTAAKVADIQRGEIAKGESIYDAGTLFRILANKHL